MKKSNILSIICLVFFQCSFAQQAKAGFSMLNTYGEELYMKSDSTQIMTYNILYSNHFIKKDSTLIADDIEVYLPDVTSEDSFKKGNKKYTYYIVSIDEIDYNRSLPIDSNFHKGYIVKDFEPTKEWKKVVFSEIKSSDSDQTGSLISIDCPKLDDNGYKVIFKKMFEASKTLLVLRENVSQKKMRFDEYFSSDCETTPGRESFATETMKLVNAKEMVIFYYLNSRCFSIYSQWKK